ncbi:MAG: hypothetical protein ACOX4I_00835 [Anaerovoracaceae bacterium]
MDSKSLISRMKAATKGGGDFITVGEYSSWRGVDRSTGRRKLKDMGLEKVEGKYYFIPDIAKIMIRELGSDDRG